MTIPVRSLALPNSRYKRGRVECRITRLRGRSRREGPMVHRVMRGAVRTAQAAEYVDYIDETGLREYLHTPGNRGAQMVTRDLGDGTTEVLTLSWWDDLDSIRGFAGDQIEAATYYHTDERFLVERTWAGRHYVVASA